MIGFGYVDESGVHSDQQVLTVGLVIFEGKFAARKIHEQALLAVYSKGTSRQVRQKLRLHYHELNESQKRTVGSILGGHKIRVYGSFYFHNDYLPHEQFALVYRNMVTACILASLDDYKMIDVRLARQGSNDISELVLHIEASVKALQKDRKIRLGSATNASAGVQLADFYVGAIRDYFLGILANRHALAKPYELVQHQIMNDLILEPGLPSPLKRKRTD